MTLIVPSVAVPNTTTTLVSTHQLRWAAGYMSWGMSTLRRIRRRLAWYTFPISIKFFSTAFVPAQMFIVTKGKTIITIVRIGAASENPNHKTERKAQQTAGNVKRTMIQLSKKISIPRLNPIRRPSAIPTAIEMAKPSNIRESVSATTS